MIASEIEVKIPDTTNLITKTALNSKATETEYEIPSTTRLFSTLEFNRLAKIGLDSKIKGAKKNLVGKSKVDTALDIADENKEKI